MVAKVLKPSRAKRVLEEEGKSQVDKWVECPRVSHTEFCNFPVCRWLVKQLPVYAMVHLWMTRICKLHLPWSPRFNHCAWLGTMIPETNSYRCWKAVVLSVVMWILGLSEMHGPKSLDYERLSQCCQSTAMVGVDASLTLPPTIHFLLIR
jgi:hypothetical protein